MRGADTSSHANATETARAIALLYALTGSFDQSGGNVLLPGVPAGSIAGEELLARPLAPAIGAAERPLGPARSGNVSALDFYRAVLEDNPYKVRCLIGFGGNLLLAYPDPVRGRAALAALDFYAQADMFMTPTAALADVVLPVASSFEREALRIGFEIDADAQSLVQLRSAVVPPPGDALPDIEVIFRLATRLGFADQFWNGDIDAAYRHQLGPSGLTLEQLRANPQGIRVPLKARYVKYAALDAKRTQPACDAVAPGGILVRDLARARPCAPTGLRRAGCRSREGLGPHDAISARAHLREADNVSAESASRPALLRKRAIAPEVELHPETAAARGIAEGNWVRISTPAGGARAKARFNTSLDPRVVVGEHGWSQASNAIEAPGYDPFSSDSVNFNLTIDATIRSDPGTRRRRRTARCQCRQRCRADGNPLLVDPRSPP